VMLDAGHRSRSAAERVGIRTLTLSPLTATALSFATQDWGCVRHEVGGSPSLWRINIGRNRQVEPLPIPVENSLTLALSPRGNKIVYTRDSANVNIWTVDLNHDHRPERIRPQITSTWGEENPQFSPDGRRIAYQSSRSGRMEIWVCDRDGSHPHQLTQLGLRLAALPAGRRMKRRLLSTPGLKA
jgi:Tol biopolymer transport system component